MERKWWTLIAICAATFMLLLDITVVNTALPSIRKDLHSSFTDLQWVVDAYALTLAAFVLTSRGARGLHPRFLHDSAGW
jgi:MFS family permease